MRADPRGLYVHIPFCKRKCNYCDFCSFPIEEKREYLDALCREIDSYKDERIYVDTVFFGGGTPSLLSEDELSKILSAIRKSFVVSPDTEITLEANPKTLTQKKVEAYRTLGVNRISLGLQSIHENELKILGRIHSFDEFVESYNMILSSGIDNINVDLMYGIPEQTKESFEATLRRILSLDPSHISVYGLILEEGTPLHSLRESLTFPTEDEECEMYYLAARLLSENGYRHYEVSNYAKEGRESRHNLKYWRGEEYVGVGLSAYSYYKGKRFGNTKDMSEYVLSPLDIYDEETIDKDNEKYEYVMLRTRLSEGFSLSDYKRRFGEDFLLENELVIKAFVDAGYINISGDRLSFTERGFYVGNSLLTELI